MSEHQILESAQRGIIRGVAVGKWERNFILNIRWSFGITQMADTLLDVAVPLKPSGKFKARFSTPIPFIHLRWLVHGFSTRPGGFSRAYGKRSLNLGFTREDTQRR